MKRELKPGDRVCCACTNFNSGETWIEEHVVKEITENRIVTTHVADHRKRDGKIVRIECREKEHEGGPRDIDYYSRPIDEILTEHVDQNRWLCEQFMKLNSLE